MVIKEMTDGEVNYVRKSFAVGYARIHKISPALAGAMLEPLLGAWDCFIAEAEGVPGEILGWILARDKRMLGWVSVKQQYRRHGIAELLLNHVGVVSGSVDACFFSPHATKIAKEKGIIVRWRPYEPFAEAEYADKVASWVNSAVAQTDDTVGALPEVEIE